MPVASYNGPCTYAGSAAGRPAAAVATDATTRSTRGAGHAAALSYPRTHRRTTGGSAPVVPDAVAPDE